MNAGLKLGLLAVGLCGGGVGLSLEEPSLSTCTSFESLDFPETSALDLLTVVFVRILKNASRGVALASSSIWYVQIHDIVNLDQHLTTPHLLNTVMRAPEGDITTWVTGKNRPLTGSCVGAGSGLLIGDHTSTLWSIPTDTMNGQADVATRTTSKKWPWFNSFELNDLCCWSEDSSVTSSIPADMLIPSLSKEYLSTRGALDATNSKQLKNSRK
ncbi:hypothetical protein OGAPHI_003628 [Ogataea philodendri]|uniref:Uncharacterized protein n=1 Tax=Ogataea philodendri TaxID=1378263 RepID=A0A9P8P698_9ASCO|nr:uncharacterized protein OGAPHI_003628 [Ogataea philodendri]KAH3665444.1 hypothetical protein OGAPHI_003628 [Ogataea philodendri]